MATEPRPLTAREFMKGKLPPLGITPIRETGYGDLRDEWWLGQMETYVAALRVEGQPPAIPFVRVTQEGCVGATVDAMNRVAAPSPTVLPDSTCKNCGQGVFSIAYSVRWYHEVNNKGCPSPEPQDDATVLREAAQRVVEAFIKYSEFSEDDNRYYTSAEVGALCQLRDALAALATPSGGARQKEK